MNRDQAVERAAELEFMRKFEGKSSTLAVRCYEEWMSSRAHRKVL
jgi:hypothetical protein